MRWWPLVAIAILAAPLAGAQAQVEATMTVRHVLPFAELEPRDDVRDDDALRACGNAVSHFRELSRGFEFHEGVQEAACADAQFYVRAPVGQQSLVVQFDADKHVRQQAPLGPLTLAVQVVTTLILEDALTGDVLATVPYMDAAEADERLHDHAVTFDVSQAPRDLVVVFHFGDEGPTGTPAPALGGQEVTVQIVHPRILFPGVPLAGGTERVVADVTRDTVQEHLRLVGRVPPGVDVAAVTFTASNDLSIDHVVLPNGARLASTAFAASEQSGLLSLVLGEDVVQTFGAGEYVAVFASTSPLIASPVLTPLVILLMVSPVPTGVYATRSAGRLVAETSGMVRRSARALRLTLYFWWAVYISAVAFVVFGQLWPLVVSWPLQVQAAIVHGAFALVLGTFIALGVYWRRQLTVTMEAELVERSRMNRNLARTNAELEQFAYVASHDLQEPLRTVARFTQLLERRYGDQLDAEAKEFMTYSVEGAQRMQQLIEGLLTFSRAGRGGEKGPVDLSEVMDQVLTSLTVQLEEADARVTPDAMPLVHGDRVQLAQLLQNLISNAVKFRAPDRPPVVEVSAERSGKIWTIAVRDNGIGIDPAYHERIFVVFQRLHAREAYEGMGIGLALCKKIVERHGGQIWLESTPGVGSTFSFTLLDGHRGDAG